MKNKKIVWIIIGIVSIALIALAITYAYWQITKTQQGTNVVTAACLDISLSNEQNDITLTEQYPITDEEGTKLTPYTFTVTNNCNVELNYNIHLESTGDSTTALKSSSIKSKLDDNFSTLLSERESVEPTITGAYQAYRLGRGKLAKSGETGSSVTHELRLWIDEDAPVSEANKTFTSKVSVATGQIELTSALKSVILASNGGESSIKEISATKASKAISLTETNLLMELNSPKIYWGTDYDYDSTTGLYTLSGDVVEATWEQCQSGSVSCGDYTLNSDLENTEGMILYHISSWDTTTDYHFGQSGPQVDEVYSTNLTQTNTASDTKGLYKTQDNDGTSYYFRGAVDNNYIKFGSLSEGAYEYCYQSDYWDEEIEDYGKSCHATLDECLASCNNEFGDGECSESSCPREQTVSATNVDFYWRIVRINGDGTVRLVYDGTSAVKNGTTHTTTLPEELTKPAFENLLRNNNSKAIANSYFCNDYEFPLGQGYSTYLSVGSLRLNSNFNPTYICDRYVAYIGELTMDEIYNSSIGYDISKDNTYLYTGNIFKASTLSGGDAEVQQNFYFGVSASGAKTTVYGPSQYNSISLDEYYRYVINISGDAMVSGSGTVDDPYVIDE